MATDLLNPGNNRRQGFACPQFPTPDPDVLFRDIDLLSLDVLDTILVRRCLAPQNVFSWIETRTRQAGFARDRVMAETAARKAHRNRAMEVTHYEKVLGLRAARDLKRGEPLVWDGVFDG